MKDGPLKEKSYIFALKIVKLANQLQAEKKEYVLSKQIVQNGTTIGALIREAEFGQSRVDFTSKMSITLKEANETEYWLTLLKDTKYFDEVTAQHYIDECKELIAMLVATVKTSKQK